MGMRLRNMDEFPFHVVIDGVAAAAPTNYDLVTDAAGQNPFYAPFDCWVRGQLYVNVEGVSGGGPLPLAFVNVTASNQEVSSRALVTSSAVVGDEIVLPTLQIVVPKGNVIAIRGISDALTGGTFDAHGLMVLRRLGDRETL